jgi:hypothetical protein
VVGDANLTTQAEEWLDNILFELEGVGYWRFLETSSPVSTVNADYDYAWPATYSKGMMISTSEPRFLVQIPHAAMLPMLNTSTGNPKLWSRWDDLIHLYPTPVTGSLPTLSLYYYSPITLPTEDTSDLSTTVLIPKKFHKFLLDGMIAQGLKHIDDERQDSVQQKWEQGLLMMMSDNEEFVAHREGEVDRSTEQLKPRET